MFSNLCLSTCLFVFGVMLTCAFVISNAENRQFTVTDLCHSGASYGTVLTQYDDACGLMCCVSRCMATNSCVSCIYDETNGVCSLNSFVKLSIVTCTYNVKYVQLRDYRCLGNDELRICGFDVPSTFPVDTITGVIQVYISQQALWGHVCDDYWEVDQYGPNNARTFCQGLNYRYGATIYPLNQQPYPYTDPIILDDVRCTDTSTHLLTQCTYTHEHNCGYTELVSVSCYDLIIG